MIEFNSKSFFTLTLALIVWASPIVNAQDSKGYSLSPSFHVLELKPGEEREITTNIKNNESTAATLSTKFTNAEFSSNSDGMYKFSDKVKNRADQWMTASETNVNSINPSETIGLKYKIKVPSDTAPGGYYPVIVNEIKIENPNAQVASKIEFGSIIYIDVKNSNGESNIRKAEIVEFKSNKKFTLFPEMDFQLRARNTSSLHYKFVSQVSIIDPSGNISTNVSSFNNNFLFLTPNQIFNNQFNWKAEDKKLFPEMGKYTAQLDIFVIDRPSENSQAFIEFYVIPYQYLIIVSVILILLIAESLRRSAIKRKQKYREI